MKKKLSNSKHIHWIIAFLVAIGLGYLFILIEFVKMHDRHVLFYNLKTVNLVHASLSSKSPLGLDSTSPRGLTAGPRQTSILDKNSPLFFIHKDKIVFGSIQSLVMPKLEKDSLVLKKESFQEQFKQKIDSYKNTRDIFPAKVVGISFQDNLNYPEKLKIMSEISILIKNENKKMDHNIIPSIVFVDTLPSI